MELALRGMGALLAADYASCYQDSGCRAMSDFLCYGPGYFDPGCSGWRAYNGPQTPSVFPAPPTIKPPVIDTDPLSPTYGQAIVNGQVVATAEQAEILYQQQRDAAEAARQAQVMGIMNEQERVNCAVVEADCGAFTSPNPDCTMCVFDPMKPAFLFAAGFAFLLLVTLKR